MNRKIGVRTLATLALLLVSLYLYGCSPSASPQKEMKVLVLEPESLNETIQESAGESLSQAKIAPQEQPVEAVEEQAQTEATQPEPVGGVGGGAPEVQSFSQAAPAPAPESNPGEVAPAPQAVESGSTVEPTVGSQAPEFNLQTLDGQSVDLSALRGKNVLLSYWVTWCIPCMEELPVLNRLYQEYQAQNLVILSVNGIQQDDLNQVQAALAEQGISMPIALDQGDALYNSYWVRFLPTSFFIDEDGVIRHIQLGSLSEENLRSKIEQLISDQL